MSFHIRALRQLRRDNRASQTYQEHPNLRSPCRQRTATPDNRAAIPQLATGHCPPASQRTPLPFSRDHLDAGSSAPPPVRFDGSTPTSSGQQLTKCARSRYATASKPLYGPSGFKRKSETERTDASITMQFI